MRETLSILVVNADDATVRTISSAIKDYPSSMVCCASSEALLDRVMQEDIDVVLLDFQPPFENAFDLLSELRTRSPQTEVVFVSRFDDEELWVEAVQRGAYDFLPKPVDRLELK